MSVTNWNTRRSGCGGSNEGRPSQASERHVPPQCAMEEVFFGSFWRMSSPLSTTDDAVTSRTVNSRWNAGGRCGVLGNCDFLVLQSVRKTVALRLVRQSRVHDVTEAQPDHGQLTQVWAPPS